MKKIYIIICFIITTIISSCMEASAITDTIYASEMGMFAISEDNSLWALRYYDNDIFVTEPKKIIENVVSVSLGYAIRSDGSLWKFLDLYDDLTRVNPNIIEPIEVMQNIKYVSSMFYFSGIGTAIIKEDNTLRSLNGTGESKKMMNNVADVAITPFFCIALKTDGSVWSIGMNDYGQLGNGTYESSEHFSKVMENVKNIEVSTEGSFAFQEDDTLYRWGSINSSWLGGGILTPTLPMKYVSNAKGIANVIAGVVFVNKGDGSLWCYGQSSEKEDLFDFNMPCKIDIDNVYDISGKEDGSINILILKENGELYLRKWYDENLEKLADNIKLPQKNVEFIKKDFTDISNKPEEMQKSIKSLCKAGIIKGSSDTTYSPDESISRAETAALLLRMTGKSNETANVEFSDVTPNKWYYSTAGVSQKYGILNGYDDNTFRGEEKISKLQFVSLASRVLRDESFEDITQYEEKRNELNAIPDWAKDDINLALNSKLVDEDDISDDWNKKITRGEAAVVLYRLYNKI